MLYLIGSEHDEVGVYCPLNCITLIYENDANVITRIGDSQGGESSYIKSCTNHVIEVASLNCHTYDEFIIALELHNLLHSPNIDINNWSKIEKNQMEKIRKLKQENIRLQKIITQLKALVDAS